MVYMENDACPEKKDFLRKIEDNQYCTTASKLNSHYSAYKHTVQIQQPKYFMLVLQYLKYFLQFCNISVYCYSTWPPELCSLAPDTRSQ